MISPVLGIEHNFISFLCVVSWNASPAETF
jgi:hypothetical protein